MKPGWKTSEYWTTTASQILGILTILGLMNGHDAHNVEEAIAKIVTGFFLTVTNGWIVVRYIQSRLHLKLAHQGYETPDDPPTDDDGERGSSNGFYNGPKLAALFLLCPLVWMAWSTVQAAHQPKPAPCGCPNECKCSPQCNCAHHQTGQLKAPASRKLE